MPAPIPACEPERLRALDRYDLLDTPPEPEFENLTTLAAKFFDVPIALISLVDSERQWFKACHGWGQLKETPREVAFCAFTILGHHPLIVPDARLDERFRNNPLVTGPPHVRFYAGAPLTTLQGDNLGDLCLMDTVPRTLSDDQKTSLTHLADTVMAAIEARRTEQRLRHEIEGHEQTSHHLRVVEARYKRIAKNSPGVVHQFIRRVDGSAEFPFVSDACREILELEPAALQARANAYFELVYPEDRAVYEQAAAAAIASLTTLDWEGRYLTPSGRLKWVHLSSHPERMANGDIHWDGVILDITARKHTESALRQAKLVAEEARAAAEKADNAKSEFLSRMSHELRTPLNAILGFGQLLESSPLGEQDALGVKYLLKGARHLLALVDEVLDLSSAETGALHLVSSDVDTDLLVQECVSLVARQAQARGITCKVETAPDGPLRVRADEQRLRQILLNLLSNAIKYNRENGEIVLSRTAMPGGRLRFSVRDTGLGISPEGLARLFIPFERLEQTRGTVEGTGLGLVVSRRIAEAMGGRLDVQSEVGHGSTFSLEIPQDDIPAASAQNAPPPHAPDAAQETSPAATLLYIEDNQSNRQVMEMLFASRRPQWTIFCAADGKAGLEQACRVLPDLILLDLQLPEMPGDAVLGNLRNHPQTQAIPVVILSADATIRSQALLINGGADDYISKPFGVDDLLCRLDRVLRKTRRLP